MWDVLLYFYNFFAYSLNLFNPNERNDLIQGGKNQKKY